MILQGFLSGRPGKEKMHFGQQSAIFTAQESLKFWVLPREHDIQGVIGLRRCYYCAISHKHVGVDQNYGSLLVP